MVRFGSSMCLQVTELIAPPASCLFGTVSDRGNSASELFSCAPSGSLRKSEGFTRRNGLSERPRLNLDDDVSAELEVAGYLALAPPAWGVTSVNEVA